MDLRDLRDLYMGESRGGDGCWLGEEDDDGIEDGVWLFLRFLVWVFFGIVRGLAGFEGRVVVFIIVRFGVRLGFVKGFFVGGYFCYFYGLVFF